MEKTLEQLQSEKRNVEAQTERLTRQKDDIVNIMERTANRIEQLKKEEKQLTEGNIRIKKEFEETKVKVEAELTKLNAEKQRIALIHAQNLAELKNKGPEGQKRIFLDFINKVEFLKKQITEDLEKFRVKLHRIAERIAEKL